ncbi:exodeoxyribonuclease III [Limnohabitans sp. MMS-10A-160]|uniref:exodeoxyribonuclease III n=1 Tax=unclassified Limnohabitans TaxID=2626134 RepID=UPI000D348E15|nr:MULTISPECIES: exodeoxyribonuclease III [unclassified Limnohabitans]PUE21941.1 exodeoxyribonuclease III [Limnohabitans sp. MMS-10A-192]PUE25591.1 exodeoxyribonuclease III [Limnohabitans sp. MMS-10A-160]
MKIATWNVNSLSVRLPQVLDWLAANPTDVLALQELKLTDDKFPVAAFTEAGYQAHWFGQKTYNGVALISRSEGVEVVKNIPGFEDDMSRVIAATYGDVRVIGAYFPNGQAPDSDKFVYKMRWLDALRDWVKDEMTRHPNLVLLGDYNITFDALDMWDPIALAGTIHCTDAEREKLQALIDLGLTDSFRLFEQPEKSYSWWDYREFAFRRNRGLRIDHILISQALKARATACVIDRAPRKNERPSDHAPVVLTLGD